MIKPTAFYGTPTYALRLAQVAAEEGVDPRDFQLKMMFFSGEPGASIPSVRDKIEQLYAAKVFDCGSMAEMTPWMNVAGSAQTSGMLCWRILSTQRSAILRQCDASLMASVEHRSILTLSARPSR
jgi:phenylacetate-coenzyme A ligase PaaK-like adenylate-forming protein